MGKAYILYWECISVFELEIISLLYEFLYIWNGVVVRLLDAFYVFCSCSDLLVSLRHRVLTLKDSILKIIKLYNTKNWGE